MKEGVNLLYDSVVVNLGARCNASCEHCCFSCSPTKKEALDKNEVINLVENFSN
ncbi:YydG family peptide radical SAM peptide maturase, partial [Enterococcus faecalis]|nr:YydG family peptide radical SAM peptide maturase [Enterococcus faecalis]